MKKSLIILSLIFAISIVVSCVEEDDLEDDFSSSDTAPAETGDTTPADPADTTPADPADTEDSAPADTTDTGTIPADPADTGDTGSTPADPADTGSSQPDQGCTPQCGGKECGSDGCGGQCGTCPENHTCSLTTNTCQCDKSCEGKKCTDDDGCGGTCGCKSNEECNAETGACECVPHCEESWQCGGDGCGGSCGSCKEEEVCTESTHTCKGCTTVTLSPIADGKNPSNNGYLQFKTLTNAYTPNTGDTSQDDLYALSFKYSVPKIGEAIDLSTSIDKCNGKDLMRNLNALCFFINEDHEASSDPKRFLPKTGTITFSSVSKDPKMNAEIKGVKMYEMVQDNNNNYYFVEGGDCIVVEDTTLKYPAE